MKKHTKKLRFLLRGREINYERARSQVEYTNVSSVTFNKHQDAVLKLGPKHILDDKINLKETIPRIEGVLDSVNCDKREKLRGKIQGILEKHMKIKEQDSEDRKALKEIKRNEKIICAKTDKTGRIAIGQR